MVIDRFYIDAMESGSLEPAAWAHAEPWATALPLKTAQSEMDGRLIKLVRTLDEHDLERTVAIQRDDHVQHEPMSRLLLHLFQHQVHHRGQVHAMLSGTSVPPPQLEEFFSVEEAPLRARDFTELGWTEAGIIAQASADQST